MITRHISALLFALIPLWVSASVYAEEVSQVNPVTAIDEKIRTKQNEINAISAEYEAEESRLQQFRKEVARLQFEADELEAKRNRAKSALDKQYTRLLDDPDTDLKSYQKEYQAAWELLKANQAKKLDNTQSLTEGEMRLAQMRQKQARLNTELANLEESFIDIRIRRLESELQQSRSLDVNYKTTCAPTLTLGECASRGMHFTKQRAINTFREQLLNNVTEAATVKQFQQGVELNIQITDSQTLRSGFEGDNEYATQLQAQLQAKPDSVAACKLLNVSSRYCLASRSNSRNTTTKKTPPPAPVAKKPTPPVSETPAPEKNVASSTNNAVSKSDNNGTVKTDIVKTTDKSEWATVTVRSNQYRDTVTINGVNYGNTPVEVKLPNGDHQFTITKDGYDTYNRTLTIYGNDTIWVKLNPIDGK